jgi:tRNA(Arg) A34 adenosine deaminase TadA
VDEPRPQGASAHYKHAEIDVLIQAAKNGQLSGKSATLYVTEHPCAGACLTTNFRGNIVSQFKTSGMKSLTIESPDATIVLGTSPNGNPVVTRYVTR